MKLLVISSMKDEAPYLLEWIAHHRAVGFTDFLIYTNDCSDGTDFMLDRLQERGIVRHKRTNVLRRGPQKSAFKDAIGTDEFATADWVYVTDADEFLCIKVGDGNVSDLIASYPKADVIPVTWRHFSTSGEVALPKGPICKEYTDAEPGTPTTGEPGRFVKSLFKNGKYVEKLGLHAPKLSDASSKDISWGSSEWLEDPNANPTRPKSNFGYEIAQVNHYPLKSVDSYLMKRRRGRANHFNETLGTEYWDRWNLGGEYDASIDQFSSRREEEMSFLLEDGLTAHLHNAAISLTANALSSYLKEPGLGALRAGLIVKSERQSNNLPQKKPKAAPQIQKEKPSKPKREVSDKKAKRIANRRRLLKRMPANGRCAEIGVWNGDFSEQILDVAKPSELTLVDPWGLLAEGPSEDWNHKKHSSSDAMDTMFQHVTKKFKDNENVIIRKGFSGDVLSQYPDDYFDWVYIDGNHQYEFVKSDIEMCFRKVRKNGIIAGDDFFWERLGRRHVRDAVIDVLKEKEIETNGALSRIGQQFMINVEKKEVAKTG